MDPIGPPKNTDNATTKLAEREAKKQCLRELRDAHDWVKKIVAHIGKHYKEVGLPAWLDLRVVYGQLSRSAAGRRSSAHAAWKTMRDSLTAVQAWMGGHGTWEDAAKVSKMPHFGSSSELKAVEFIESKQACLPRCLMLPLVQIKLDFLVDPQPRGDDEIPDFWRGARLNNPEWRRQFMQKQGYYHHIPFDDDLTDLVVSTVVQKGKPELEDTMQPLAPAEAEEDNEPKPTNEAKTKAGMLKTGGPGGPKGAGNGAVWKDKVQATMSRIADTVNETLAAEQVKLLGKRYRQDNDKTQPETHQKRQKTAEEVVQPQKVMDSIEDSDDDDPPAPSPSAKTCVDKDDERYRALKAGYKKLKKQDLQLASLYSNIDDSTKKQGKDVEQLTKQQKDLRRDTNANKQKQQQLVERFDTLEAGNKALEEKAEQLTVQCAALTDDVRKLEDKSGQVAAQCSAFEDENKILRSQLVSVMARIEALEQAQSAAKSQPEPAQTTAPEPASAPKPAEEGPRVQSRQHSVVEAPRGRDSLGPQDNVHGAAAPTVPSSQWQSAGAVKYEAIDSLVMNQPPQPHYKRAGSRFPRVLDMPTFDPDWDPQQEVLSRRAPAYARSSRLTTYSDAVYTNSPTAYHPYANPAARGPTPSPSPVHIPAPTQMAGPVQMRAPTPAYIPAHTPTPVPTQPAGSTPTFTPFPSSSPHPEFSPNIDPSLYTTATLQPQPQTQPTQHEPTPNQHTNPNPNTGRPPTNTTLTLTPDNNTNNNAKADFESSLQTHLPWLPPAHRTQLLAFMGGLPRHIWQTLPAHEIVAHCRARGLRYERVGELVEGYRRVVADVECLSGGGDGDVVEAGQGGWGGVRDGSDVVEVGRGNWEGGEGREAKAEEV
ncbi:hypothetical protein C8A01DRAFT_16777 [Parachaetomium inaequale]|uniref:Uncharacterized protein n=1 Tax=Parachaetomium inaequale TaxID=2588326 RepID=A0AAN6PEM1_9PEZI|nr:hypothetical protein C8A01DRAFT_16777 [Parachaetomium inaequale]